LGYSSRISILRRHLLPLSQLDALKASPGVYILLVELVEESQIIIGELGLQTVPKGFYLYVGSALGKASTSLGWRMARYLNIHKRKHRWHIDYLLNSEHAEISGIFFAKTHEDLECALSKEISIEEWIETPLKGFGSSDCLENCPAHLYRSKIDDVGVLTERIIRIFKGNNLTPENLKLNT
jgi:Uri superfamily endonuclease